LTYKNITPNNNKMIKYKGKEYPTRTFTMTSSETGEVTYTIADETLFDAISEEKDSSGEELYLTFGTDEWRIDQNFYFYVETGKIELSAEEICKDCLDIEFEFISEEI
jgi:hypothetical protein